MSLSEQYLADIVRRFRDYKALGEGAMSQVTDADLHRRLDADANSIALIVKHLSGNLRSRLSDFLTTDGEKSDRNRDGEFETADAVPRDEVLAWWQRGWDVAMTALDALTPADLERTVTIRGEPFLVVEALNRIVAHMAYHVGQIVLLAKHFVGTGWTSLSIPKGQSREHAVGTFKQSFVPPRPS